MPPSSPPGRPSEAGSSEETSDDSHFAEDEETDGGGSRPTSSSNQLKRRVTLHDIAKPPARPLKSRSLSMGNLLGLGDGPKPLPLRRKASTTVVMDQAAGSSTRCVSSVFLSLFVSSSPGGERQRATRRPALRYHRRICRHRPPACARGRRPCPCPHPAHRPQ